MKDEANSDDLNLPLPAMDEGLVDLKYIHWGYVHCCQIVVKGRKVKKENWLTCWLELSGTVFRIYKDTCMPADSAAGPVPSDSNCPLTENLSTLAFLDVRSASVKMLHDGKVFHRTLTRRRTVRNEVYRRHLFQVKMERQGAVYVFQARSTPSMLMWISKIQESIDATEDNQISFLAEEKMNLVKYIMSSKQENAEKSKKIIEEELAEELDAEIMPYEAGKPDNKLQELKLLLSEKKDLEMQMEKQIMSFLGNKGAFKREECTCTLSQDYHLVAGCHGTLLPRGCPVTVFGQLRNRRWRCHVNREDLLNTLNNNSGETKSGVSREVPDYPLIGSLPTSVLIFNGQEKEAEDDAENSSCDQEEIRPPPYEVVTASRNLKLTKSWSVNVSTSSLQSIGPTEDEDTTSVMSSVPSDFFDPTDVVSEDSDKETAAGDTLSEVLYRRNPDSSILIRKKLRHKGISILVGSSSSESEGDEVVEEIDEGKNFSYTNAVYKRMLAATKPRDEEQLNEDQQTYIRTKGPKKPLNKSFSCDQINYKGEFTIRPDLLKTFGNRSIRLDEEKQLCKDLIQVFQSQKGPDVKPPRNERRTLKLSKSDEQGFGFWLQTYNFVSTAGDVDKRTFVRYVEDEGAAYLAGLREGDVIVEIDDVNVENCDHCDIVKAVSLATKKLKLLVKFMDAVKHAELTVRLKKRKAQLIAKKRELQKLRREEKAILNGASESSNGNCDEESPACRSVSPSTCSQLSVTSSTPSDDVIVRTSKFEKRSSRVLDSLKELSCVTPGNQANFCTDHSLLASFSSDDVIARATRRVQRTESMPVQKPRPDIVPKLELEIYDDACGGLGPRNSAMPYLDSESDLYNSSSDSLYSSSYNRSSNENILLDGNYEV